MLRRRGVEAGSSRRRGVQQPKVSADLKCVSHEQNAKWDLSHLISYCKCGRRGAPWRTWPSATQCQTTSSACGQRARQRAPRPSRESCERHRHQGVLVSTGIEALSRGIEVSRRSRRNGTEYASASNSHGAMTHMQQNLMADAASKCNNSGKAAEQ